MELTAVQIIVIGLVASFVAQGVKILAARTGKPIGRKWVTVALMIVAIFLSFIWARPALPTWPAPVEDPMAYATLILAFFGQLLAVASAIIGFAVLIYNLLLERVFEKLGAGKEYIAMTSYAAATRNLPPDDFTSQG